MGEVSLLSSIPPCFGAPRVNACAGTAGGVERQGWPYHCGPFHMEMEDAECSQLLYNWLWLTRPELNSEKGVAGTPRQLGMAEDWKGGSVESGSPLNHSDRQMWLERRLVMDRPVNMTTSETIWNDHFRVNVVFLSSQWQPSNKGHMKFACKEPMWSQHAIPDKRIRSFHESQVC